MAFIERATNKPVAIRKRGKPRGLTRSQAMAAAKLNGTVRKPFTFVRLKAAGQLARVRVFSPQAIMRAAIVINMQGIERKDRYRLADAVEETTRPYWVTRDLTGIEIRKRIEEAITNAVNRSDAILERVP